MYRVCFFSAVITKKASIIENIRREQEKLLNLEAEEESEMTDEASNCEDDGNKSEDITVTDFHTGEKNAEACTEELAQVEDHQTDDNERNSDQKELNNQIDDGEMNLTTVVNVNLEDHSQINKRAAVTESNQIDDGEMNLTNNANVILEGKDQIKRRRAVIESDSEE